MQGVRRTRSRSEEGPSEFTSPEPRNVTLPGNGTFEDVMHSNGSFLPLSYGRTRSSRAGAGPKPDGRTRVFSVSPAQSWPVFMRL